MNDEYMPVGAVAKLTGIESGRIYRNVRKGHIGSKVINGRIQVRPADVANYVEADPQPEWSYTAPQVRRLTGATYRQIDHWQRKGYISTITPVKGTGRRRRLYDFHEVAVIATAAGFCRLGFTPAAAFAQARRLHDPAVSQ